jgi:hypothetical protein
VFFAAWCYRASTGSCGEDGTVEFVGEEAPDELRQRYVGKRVSDEY